MIIVETFINKLDNEELQKIYSDSNFYIKEIATGVEYEEAVISIERSVDEFIETDKLIEKEEGENYGN